MRGERARHLRRVAAAFNHPGGIAPLYRWLKQVWKRRVPADTYAALRRMK